MVHAHIIAALAGVLLLVSGILLGGFALVASVSIAIQTALASTSAWAMLSAIAPIIAPLLVLALTVVGRFMYNHEKRIRELEKSETRQSRTLYGDKDDPQQDGLARDIHTLTDRMDELEGLLKDVHDEVRELNDSNE